MRALTFKMAAPIGRRKREDLLRLAIENDEGDAICFLLPKFGPTTYDPDFPKFHLVKLTDERCRNYFRFDEEVGVLQAC